MKTILIPILLSALIVGCGAKKAENVATNSSTSGETASTRFNLPPDHPPVGEGEDGSGTGRSGDIAGRVLETLEAPPYTYMRLDTPKGEIWAATPKADVKVGEDVVIASMMTADDFESKTLNRKFEHLIMGNLVDSTSARTSRKEMPPGMQAMQGSPSLSNPHAGMAAKPAIDVTNIKVEKASGAEGRSVAEIWSTRASLKGKTVSVRGKVVKFLPGIMGRNWVHLRDGSGTDKQRDNDLTVTTPDTVSVGDVVTARGVVDTDKDFGAGYAYPVILENAKLTR